MICGGRVIVAAAMGMSLIGVAAASTQDAPSPVVSTAQSEAPGREESQNRDRITVGDSHSCAVLNDGAVRCWGQGTNGQLGYGNANDIGDDETPGSVEPVELGPGRTAVAVTAGGRHTCALLDNGTVLCWGAGYAGQLGYGNTESIGDNETPGTVGPVDLGVGRTAVAITAGSSHTCALLDNDTVLCWGDGVSGQLGYGNTRTIGDDETPGSVGPVDLGAGRTATTVTAGGGHTCALLDDGAIRCWGWGAVGTLGYGNTDTIGDNETPGSVGPVDLGAGPTPVAVFAGGSHSCALLDGGTVRCWGHDQLGQLGLGGVRVTAETETRAIGDDETPGSVGPVDLGAGRTATAVAAGGDHTCALLDAGTVGCWGHGLLGKLGHGTTAFGARTFEGPEDEGCCFGDEPGETPGSLAPVNLGTSKGAVAISAGAHHSCALLGDGTVSCWGWGAFGALGYGNTDSIGDDETPGSAGPVDLGGRVSSGPSTHVIAATGSDTGPIVLVAITAVLLGSLFVFAARRDSAM